MTANEHTTHLDMVRGQPGKTEPVTGLAMAQIVPRYPDVEVPVRIIAVRWAAGDFYYQYEPVGGKNVGSVSAKKIVSWQRHPDK